MSSVAGSGPQWIRIQVFKLAINLEKYVKSYLYHILLLFSREEHYLPTV
jgi:hypothetical protein